MDIPRGQIEAHIQIVLGAGSRKLGKDIALAILVLGDATHVVLG